MRQNFNTNQELDKDDLNNISSRMERQFYDRVLKELMGLGTSGFFGTGLSVSRVSNTSVRIAAGLGFMTDSSQPNNEPTVRPIYLDSSEDKTLTAADATNDRIDLVVVKWARVNEQDTLRRFKAAGSSSITTQTVPLVTDWSVTINIVTGTAAATPVAPSVPSGFVKIAELDISSGTGLAAAGDITDSRATINNVNSFSSSLTALGLPPAAADVGKTAVGSATGLTFRDDGLPPGSANANKIAKANSAGTALEFEDFSIPAASGDIGKVAIGSASGLDYKSLAELNILTNRLPDNCIVSGTKSANSSQSKFFSFPATGLTATVLGGTTDLVLRINGNEVKVESDTTVTLTAAPNSNNTADLSDGGNYSGAGSQYHGEIDYIHNSVSERAGVMKVSSAGTNVRGRAGEYIAFKNSSGSVIAFGILDGASATTTMSNCKRQWLFDRLGVGISPTAGLATGNVMLNVNWIFVDSSGDVDQTIYTPWSYPSAPSSPSNGQYYYDQGLKTYRKRVSGAWTNVTGLFVGYFVTDDSNILGYRCFDFYREGITNENNTIWERQSNGTDYKQVAGNAWTNVFGQRLHVPYGRTVSIANDRLSGVARTASTWYYAYEDEDGEIKLDKVRPVWRDEYGCRLHPFETWRPLFKVLLGTGATPNTVEARNYYPYQEYNPNVPIDMEWAFNASNTGLAGTITFLNRFISSVNPVTSLSSAKVISIKSSFFLHPYYNSTDMPFAIGTPQENNARIVNFTRSSTNNTVTIDYRTHAGGATNISALYLRLYRQGRDEAQAALLNRFTG